MVLAQQLKLRNQIKIMAWWLLSSRSCCINYQGKIIYFCGHDSTMVKDKWSSRCLRGSIGSKCKNRRENRINPGFTCINCALNEVTPRTSECLCIWLGDHSRCIFTLFLTSTLETCSWDFHGLFRCTRGWCNFFGFLLSTAHSKHCTINVNEVFQLQFLLTQI